MQELQLNEKLMKEWKVDEILKRKLFKLTTGAPGFWPSNEIFIYQSSNYQHAVLVHSIAEITMGSYGARITILENKKSPSILLDHEKELFTRNPYNKKNINFSDNGDYVFWVSYYYFKDLDLGPPTLVVINLRNGNYAFYMLPGFTLDEACQISPYKFLLKTTTPDQKQKENVMNLKHLKWYDTKTLDNMGQNFKQMIINVNKYSLNILDRKLEYLSKFANFLQRVSKFFKD